MTRNKTIAATAGAMAVAGTIGYFLVSPPPPPPGEIPITFADFPAETNTNVWAQKYFYPVLRTNYFTNFIGTVTTNILTNVNGGYRAHTKMNIEWESVPGRVYVVESSHHMSDPTPMLCTNWTNSSLVSTCGWYGESWHPVMHPIQATGTVARWSGPIWGDDADVRMYRIKEL